MKSTGEKQQFAAGVNNTAHVSGNVSSRSSNGDCRPVDEPNELCLRTNDENKKARTVRQNVKTNDYP